MEPAPIKTTVFCGLVLGVLIIHQLSGVSTSLIPCAYWPAFPDGPLTVGESWPDHKRLVVPFPGMSLTIEPEIGFSLIDGAMVMRKAGSRIMEWPFRLTANAGLLLLEWR